MRRRSAVFGLVMVAVLTGAAAAQDPAEPALRPVRALGGLHFVGALPTGEFADEIDGGFGIGFDVAVPVPAGSAFQLRADVGWVVYGDETKKVCFGGGVGCRVSLDLSTTNSILYVQAGPQLMLPRGPVRPYLNASGGFSYFATTSSVKGDNDGSPFASDTNHDDFTLAWSAGGGVLIPLSHGRTPIALNLGAQYHGNGSVEYVKEGGIVDEPDGSISIHPTRSDANFVSLRLGVSFGFRPGTRN